MAKSLCTWPTFESKELLQYEVQYQPSGNLSPPTLTYHIGCKTAHDNYIPVTKFSLTDLPEDIRYQEVLLLLQLNMALAVKVSLKRVPGEERKSVAEGNEWASDEDGDRCGSGSICYFSDTHNLYRCSKDHTDNCQECHIPGCPYTSKLGQTHFLVTSQTSSLTEAQMTKAHLAFRVSTNLHVVSNDDDAKNATVELFYDSEDMSEVVTAKGVCLCEIWEEQDKVHLVCVTDMHAGVKTLLQSMRQNMRQLYASIPDGIKETFIEKYVIMLSHPHGTSKHVSVGKRKSTAHKTCPDGKRYTETRYLVETCKGCSGAPVVGPGWEDGGPGYRVHVGYIMQDSKNKIGLSKSFWVVDSDERGGADPDPNRSVAGTQGHWSSVLGICRGVWENAARLFSKRKMKRRDISNHRKSNG